MGLVAFAVQVEQAVDWLSGRAAHVRDRGEFAQVFRKLGIASRRQLRDKVGSELS
jgi:hypothetical protein